MTRNPLVSTRKIVHMSMLGFAFLLPFLSWGEAAGCAALALLFNLFILPRLDVDLEKRPVAPGFSRAPLHPPRLDVDLEKRPVAPGFSRAPLHPPRLDVDLEKRPVAPGFSRAPQMTENAAALKGASTFNQAEASRNIWTGIIIYPIAVLALILFYRHSLHIAAAVWAIMALGDGMASVVGEALRGPALSYNRQKTWSGACGFVVAATAGAYTLTRWVAPSLPTDKVLIVSAATALVGALVETLPIRLDDNATVPLVCGVFMGCAYLVESSALESNLPYLGRRLLLGVAVNLAFALLALGLKTVNRSGAVAGFFLGVAVYLGYGYKSFLIMLGFFALGSVATRLGYAKKAARGIAERRGGARSWREALANSLAGAFFALLVITTHQEGAFLVALVAAFAEAAADTVSSEIGQWLTERAYLVTTFEPVPVGENGGISLVGTVAGLAASAAIVALGTSLGLCGRGGAAVALAAAFLGTLLDSVLGATLERRGLVTNGIVNFTGTSFAGGLVLGMALQLGI